MSGTPRVLPAAFPPFTTIGAIITPLVPPTDTPYLEQEGCRKHLLCTTVRTLRGLCHTLTESRAMSPINRIQKLQETTNHTITTLLLNQVYRTECFLPLLQSKRFCRHSTSPSLHVVHGS